jgi:hypothetical protein
MAQEYATHGYGGQRYPSQSYEAAYYPPRGYSSQGEVAPGPSRGYAAGPGLPGPAAPPGYGTQGQAARGYQAQEYGDQAYESHEYGDRARTAPQYREQQYDQARTAPQYREQEYRDQARDAAQYREQQYGVPAYGPQSYPAQPYPSPVNVPPGQRPAQGYASASHGGQGLAAGQAGPDFWLPGPVAEPAAPGSAAAGPPWDAGTSVPGQATAPATPAGLAAAAAAPAAEPSAEPLYQVLGGLALRDLTLVESLLEVVEQLESREEDPQQLDSLFRVDHLATRMRRNSENLLVLAGQDRESQDFDPVSLLDVARAAVSEIADYNRAQVAPLPGVQVLGIAAADVTHILAELLDNAMSKSPESAEVVIRAERTGDGTLVVSVEDTGIGIPVDRLNEINARLSRAPVVDVAVTRHMGLYVVGRLAYRHGIRVQLRERPYGGIVASVVVPSQLIRNDPDTPRTITAVDTTGRFQPAGPAGISASRLSIEARGADGLRAQRHDAEYSATRGSAAPDAAVRGTPAGPGGRGLGAGPGARSGIGWPASAGEEADRERPARAPAAGYPDAVPVPRFVPADPSELPKRQPRALSAANGIPAPPERGEKVPVSAGEEPAMESEAERIRNELSDFQLGQRAALSDISGPGSPGSSGQQDGSGTDTDAGPEAGEPAGGAAGETGGNHGA